MLVTSTFSKSQSGLYTNHVFKYQYHVKFVLILHVICTPQIEAHYFYYEALYLFRDIPLEPCW